MKTTLKEAQKCPRCGKPMPAGALAGFCPACLLAHGGDTESGDGKSTARFQPPSLGEIAKLFPQLEILGLLGAGGMGAVYKARQPALDRIVALKVLPAAGAEGANFQERFNREARALARLSHPNIVGVHEFGRTPSQTPDAIPHPLPSLHFFIMEFVDGANLRQLERAGRLSPREALQLIPQICDALQYAHDEGVVHRDIKPENVLVDRKGRVKIADFGLAKILGQDAEAMRLTREGQVMGTPHYMAPEQVERPLSVDHRADIYSLGVVLYEMLTGDLPIGKFSPPSRKVQVDVRFDDVVLRALENDPARRYQHASEVKSQVATIAETSTTAAEEATPVIENRTEGFLRWGGFNFVAIKNGARVTHWPGTVLALVMMFVWLSMTLRLVEFFIGRSAMGWLSINGAASVWMPCLLAGVFASCGHYFAWYKMDKPGGVSWVPVSAVPRAHEPEQKYFGWLGFPVVVERDGVRDVNWKGTWIAMAVVFGLISLAFSFVTVFTGKSLFGMIGIKGGLSGVVRMVLAFLIVNGSVQHTLSSRRKSEALPRGTIILPSAARGWRIGRQFIYATLMVLAWCWFQVNGLTPWLRSRFGGAGRHASIVSRPFDSNVTRDAKSGALVAKIPGSGGVELLAINDADAAPNAWWQADGTPISNTSYTLLHASELKAAPWVTKDFVLRLVDLPQQTTLPAIELEPNGGSSFGPELLQNGKILADSWLLRAAFPPDATNATLRMGFDIDDWRTVSTHKQIAGGGSKNSYIGSEDIPNPDAMIHDMSEKDGNASVTMLVGNVRKDMNVRVVAVDAAGVEHTFNRGGNTPATKASVGSYEFFGLPLAQVTEFRIQAQRVHWVEFRDLALTPRGGPRPEAMAPSFDSVIERTFGELLDFDTGKTGEFPKDVTVENPFAGMAMNMAWMQEHGFDALAGSDKLEFVGVRIVEFAATDWDSLTPAGLNQRLADQGNFPSELTPAAGKLPATYGFRTREGGTGLLQILKFSEPNTGATVRYKLVKSHDRRAAASFAAVASQAELAELPRLRFIAWQDEWKTNGALAAWLPDGSPATNEENLKLIRELQREHSDFNFSKVGEPDPKVLRLWFSHSLFDHHSRVDVTLLDSDGEPRPPGRAGNSVGSGRGPIAGTDNLGWIKSALTPGERDGLPDAVTIRLRYVVGPLEQTQVVESGFQGSMVLWGKSELGSIGQAVDGKAFISLLQDPKVQRQFSVIAVTHGGQEFEPSSSLRNSGNRLGFDLNRYDFSLPLQHVAKFRIGTRPVRTFEWQNVVLRNETRREPKKVTAHPR
ncbi:MAG: protein kinase [Verrucomicrobia bacterium]|nr:protein kinase [Verrucomicrobiota bacterium]